VNNVVDVTNFVLFEVNQPLHAFDLDRLGSRIVVRRGRPEERFVALNAKEYRLDPEDLVIADGERPVALAGVMGGLDTEVGDGTTRVLLESAYFAPASVRRTARRHQLVSDSSFRFERGVDRSQALAASLRAAGLIIELAGGSLRPLPLDVGGAAEAPAPILLRLPRVAAVCGIAISGDETRRILESLGCGVAEAGAEALRVTPPSFRGDLRREIDLVEEVIRLHGLDQLPALSRMEVVHPRPHPGRRLREQVKDRMVAAGCMEAVTPSFVPEGLPAEVHFLGTGDAITVQNPVRSGEGALRRSLLPSLLQVRKHNHDQGNEDLRFFEITDLHFQGAAADDLPRHAPVLGFLVDGDFRDARGVAEEILEMVRLEYRVVAAETPFLAEEARAEIRSGDRLIGVLGVPEPRLVRQVGLKMKRPPTYGEIDLGALLDHGLDQPRFEGLPRYPAVTRDLSMILDEGVAFDRVREEVFGLGIPTLEALSFFDEYRGKQVGDAKKSLAIRLVFRSTRGTLTTEAVDREITRIVDRFRGELGAEIRGA
jgi:phenylalanyl-tRNA synthetase beta chain